MVRPHRIAALLALLAMGSIAPRIAQAGGPGVPVARFSVLGYETAPDGSADPSPELFTVGNRFYLIGQVTEFGPDLAGVVDPIANQYTVVLAEAPFVERTFFSSFLIGRLAPTWRFHIYEDSRATGTDAVLPAGMPTSALPASFVDGTVILTGRISNGVLLWSTASSSGQASGNGVDYDGGTALGLVPEGANFFHEAVGELAGNASPPGYPFAATDFELHYNAGLPALEVTWGRMKSRYR